MVLAHAERYHCMWRSRNLEYLHERHHIQIQVNAQTILKPRNVLVRRWVERGIENGWIDLVASDAHDLVYRPCNMRKCAEHIEREWGFETARRLMGYNANEILKYSCE